jgi:hypothetical protein
VNPLEFVFKLLAAAWPFVKEMVLEGRSLTHSFQFNRRRAIFSVAIMASFLFNIVNLGADARMFSIMTKYVKLEKVYQGMVVSSAKLKESIANNCKLPDVLPPLPAASAPVAPAPASDVAVTATTDYELLKNTFSGLNTTPTPSTKSH